MRSFSSILFRQPIFVGRPMKIHIFDGFWAIFDDFWPTKLLIFLEWMEQGVAEEEDPP
jgi:hypothetical protein